MRKVVITNQKGGTGKTSLAVHLAAAVVQKNYRTLFIDFDPQENASKSAQKLGAVVIANVSQLFLDEDFSVPELDSEHGFYLIQADAKLADIVRENPTVLNTLKSNISKLDDHFDIAIADTAPSLSLVMTGALLIADYVVSPIELEEYSIDGITKMLQTIFGVKSKWNPDLMFLGMLPNRFNSRSERQKITLDSLLENYAHLMIPAKIGIRDSIPESLSLGIPVWELKKTAARVAAKEMKEAFDFIFEKMEIA